MTTTAQIPPEVVEAAARQICGYERDQDMEWREYIGHARAAIAAALNAWPNAKTLRDDGRRQTYIVPALVLPLTTEA